MSIHAWNDLIQYILIAALFAAAIADRFAHLAYAKVLTAMWTDIKRTVERLEAKLDEDHKP